MPAFNWPDWKPLPPELDATPEQVAPPPDPAAMREQKIADDTRVEDALNRFVTARQGALFEAPDAFYRTQGVEAIHAAPVATQTLDDLRGELMGSLANDNQRQRLGQSLDAQAQLTRENMARHVSEQSLAWQRQVAQDRIATLAKEAALHHNDDELVDTLGHAAATAARAHARVGEGPPGGEAEDAAAAAARSGVLGAAIQARLESGGTGEAAALFDKLKDQLDPAHAEPLQANIDTAQRLAAAKAYAGQLVPQWADGSHDELDAQHAIATQQNQSDNRADPTYRADVQHVLDVQHATQKRGIDDAVNQRGQAVTDWLSRTGPNGEPQTSRPPPALWTRLSPDEQAALDKQLVVNARGEVPAVAGTPAAASNIGLPDAGATMLGETAKAGAEAASGLISRAAPYVGRAASGVGAAATILLVPGNTQATNIELGDGLRIRSAPGQRTVTIERQVDKGVLGTGIGARWEELPVQAEHATAPDGRSIIAIDPRQLESAIGADAVSRIRQQTGIAMARPPRDGDDEDRPPPGIGGNSENTPAPNNEQEPPPPVDPEAGARARKIADAALMARIFGTRPAPEKEREETLQAAHDIAAHAYEKHGGEFKEARSPEDFVKHINDVMNNATEKESDSNGRTIYWHEPSGTFVARNRDNPSAGTALKPPNGKAYYDDAKKEMDRQRREELQRK